MKLRFAVAILCVLLVAKCLRTGGECRACKVIVAEVYRAHSAHLNMPVPGVEPTPTSMSDFGPEAVNSV
jgi:hypothetical protein